MHIYGLRMGTGKKFRQGQILRLVSAEHIDSQDDLRRRLAHQRLRVTQATLSRDIHELKLVKTDDGYKPGAPLAEESVSLPPFTRAVREFLVDIRPAENLLVLKTHPAELSRWRRRWTARNSAKWREPSRATTRS